MSGDPMEIFSDAAEIGDPADRRAFLDRACAGDGPLRVKIEGLLEAHERIGGCSAFLSGQPPPSDGAPDVGEQGLEAGDLGRVGRYKLLQRIGEGGWGIVYMAEQTEPVRRKVALKIIRPGMDSRQVMARFEAERQALAMMDHPNIARVLDAGATENGRPYFVMELVRGSRITDYCDRNRLPTRDRLRLFIEVCQAVQHAHQKGIIHRDIKPSNILVTSDGGQPLAKVIDFGVAKATTDVQLTDKTLFTRFEMFVGTPAYMSPEQADFSAHGVDTRTDIYALGVLLYELLTGQTPFDGQTLISSGMDAMRKTICEKEPPRPSTRLRLLDGKTVQAVAQQRQADLGRLISEVRGDLDWIVLRALEKDRTRRYETANGLAMDVQRHLNCEPVIARPPSAVYAFQKWARRHRALFAGAAAVLAVLLLGTVVSTSMAWRATKAEQRQRELRAQADTDRIAADAARNEAIVRAYAADMKAAAIALSEGNSGQANALLDRHLPHAAEPDVRGFEWTVLKSRATGDAVSSFDLEGMNGGVAAAVDGSWIAGAERYGPVRVWDTGTGRLKQQFPALIKGEAHKGLAVSPDGSLLAYVGDTSTWVRDSRDWAVRRELAGKSHGVSFSPDGRLVILPPGRIQFVNPATFGIEVDLPGIATGSNSVVGFSRDGKRMAVTVQGDRFEIWDLEARTPLCRPGYVGATSIALTPDGGTALVGTRGGALTMWDAVTGAPKGTVEAHRSYLMDIAVSPDGHRLATAGGDQMVRLWKLSADGVATETGQWRGHWNEVWALHFLPDGRLVSGGKDARVKLWPNVPKARGVVTVRCPGGSQQSGFLANGSLVCVKQPQKLAFYRTADGSPAGSWDVPTGLPSQDEFRRGDEAWFCTAEGAVEVIGLPEGRVLRKIAVPGHPAAAVAGVSADGSLMAMVRRDVPKVEVVRLSDLAAVAELPDAATTSGNPVWCRFCFSPDGKKIGYAASQRRALIYDLGSHAILHELRDFLWHVYCVAWSPDGRSVVTSSWDGTVAVWNPETGRRSLPVLRGHLSGVPALSFSHDGRTLVTHGADGTVRLWNLATGTEMLSLADARCYWQGPISPDGRSLFWHRPREDVFFIETAR